MSFGSEGRHARLDRLSMKPVQLVASYNARSHASGTCIHTSRRDASKVVQVWTRLQLLVPHQQVRATVGAAPKPQHSETMMEYAATCGGHADLAVKV
jgi:hypothetical protein